jgi:hypothetical protein
MRMGGQSNNTIKSRLRANRRDYLAMKRNRIPFPLVGLRFKTDNKVAPILLFAFS